MCDRFFKDEPQVSTLYPRAIIWLGTFIAAYKSYVQINYCSNAWNNFVMPRNHRKENFEKIHPGFDQLLRLLCGHGNTMQATKQFFENNSQYIESVENLATGPAGRPVRGARLTSGAIDYWSNLPDCIRQAAEYCAELLLDGEDIDVDQENEDVVLFAEQASQPLSPLFPRDYESLIVSLVDAIHSDIPFVPIFRRRKMQPCAENKGWAARLNAYFWPNPGTGRAEVNENLKPMLANLGEVVGLVVNWRKDNPGKQMPSLKSIWTLPDTERKAIEFVNHIFEWGGVKTRTNDSFEVLGVIWNTLDGEYSVDAPMNSGWTKVAAFTASISGTLNQAIWDSRVSTAVARRLGAPARSPQGRLLRVIQGQGGTRPVGLVALRRKGWPIGWGGRKTAWNAHFAGGEIVAAIRNVLNSNLSQYGRPPDSDNWSIRDVEMVLFMDGY